jgi:SAM-dependent methyltransferase
MKPIAERGTDINLRSGPQMREYEAITARIARDAPASVLDWGCGWGQVSHLLKTAGLTVSSFDYRPEADADGLQRLERFPDVEAVLSCGVLEHVVDPDASLEELRRVLRPGGTLYVYKLPNRFSYLEWIARRLAGRGLYYHGRDSYDALYDMRSTRDLLVRHGFAIAELRRANMLPLTLDGPRFEQHAEAIWKANRALDRVPALNVLATNIEAVAKAPGQP